MVRFVGAAIVRDDNVLLGKRSPNKKHYPGEWDVFGGHVEAGESDREAILRELQEELDIDASEGCQKATSKLTQDATFILFLVYCWHGSARLNNDEHTELRWYSVADAEALLSSIDESYAQMVTGVVQAHLRALDLPKPT